jgi:hypothetical protein
MTRDEYIRKICRLRHGTVDEKNQAIDVFCDAIDELIITDVEVFAQCCGFRAVAIALTSEEAIKRGYPA